MDDMIDITGISLISCLRTVIFDCPISLLIPCPSGVDNLLPCRYQEKLAGGSALMLQSIVAVPFIKANTVHVVSLKNGLSVGE